MTALVQLKTFFIIAVTTTKMIFPGLPFIDTPEPKDSSDFESAAKSITLNLISDQGVSTAATAECTLPWDLSSKKLARLTVIPIPGEDAQPAANSAQSMKMKIYWGSAGTIPEGQPKIAPMQGADVAEKAAEKDTAKKENEGSFAYWPGKDDKPLGAKACAPGTYTLTTNYCGSTSTTLDPEQDFLAPFDLVDSSARNDPAKAYTIRWKKIANAKAYLLTATGGNSKGTIVWASSSNPEWMNVSDVTKRALAPDELQKLIKDGILLPPDTTSCVIPAGIFKDADTAILTMTAIGPDKIEEKNGISTSIIVRSTATVPISDWTKYDEDNSSKPDVSTKAAN